MPVPAYLAAAVTYPGRPGQINQFLVSHTTDMVYAGTLKSSQTTGSAVYTSTNGAYIAQQFTTASNQTAIGQVWIQISTVGGSPTSATITPLSVSIYSNSGGVPQGSAIATTTFNEQYVYSAPFWLQVPFNVTGLGASTSYQIVVAAAGNSSHYYTWQHSNQVTGGSTSPDGVNWTSQAYGMMYQIYDQTSNGALQYLFSDNGARWTQFTYDTLGRISTITENTVAQDGSDFLSVRTLSYTNGLLTVVS